VLLATAALLCGGEREGWTQSQVSISDTLKNADGSNAAGRLIISWTPFTTAAGVTVDGGTKSYTITNGAISLTLTPNLGATPTGTSYRAQYFLNNGASYTETWVVPAAGPVTIAEIRSLAPPSPSLLVASSQIAGPLRDRSITVVFGCELCRDLADDDDQPGFWRNNIGAMTVTEVWCQTDAGQSTINIQRNDGTPANILPSDLTCTPTGAATTAFAAGEAVISTGDVMDLVVVTAAVSGTPNRITIGIAASL